jgi:hypothetical protein
VTPPPAQRGAPEPPTGTAGRPDAAAVAETWLTMAGLRERGWTDAMIRDYLGEPDAKRPNPRYRTAAPMKLYLAERADAAEASPEWVERKMRGATRRAAGLAVADRKQAETEAVGTHDTREKVEEAVRRDSRRGVSAAEAPRK